MKTEFPAWVPATVADELALMEGAPDIYSQSDLACARRLVRDEAMRGFYTDAWFRRWTDPACWRVWFGYAWHAATFDYAETRDAKTAHIEAMRALRLHLNAAAQAMSDERECHEQSPLSSPLEFADPFRLVSAAARMSDRKGVAGRYESYVQPQVHRAAGRYDLRYLPDAADLLSALACFAEAWLSDIDQNWSHPAERAAMRSRQSMAIPQYVRWFDEQMSAYGWTLDDQLVSGLSPIAMPLFGKYHRIPDRLLAIQYAVSFDSRAGSMEGVVDRIRKVRLSPEDAGDEG
ncbi:hypothetical protein [Paraburkholderia caribensis]|nr:hypothetical protein [Paraburkholderia caribensis]